MLLYKCTKVHYNNHMKNKALKNILNKIDEEQMNTWEESQDLLKSIMTDDEN